MGKYRNAKPKTTSGAYIRLTGDKDIANILLKAQSTIISNGTELEKRIMEKSNVINDLDVFIANVNKQRPKENVYICPKKTIKDSKKYSLKGTEPDFLIFTFTNTTCKCTILELKDGDAFDTKKSDSEHSSLVKYTNFIAPKIPFVVNYKICCFNQKSKKAIQKGLKNRFKLEDIFTGKELCNVLHINYTDIVNERLLDQNENIKAIKSDIYKSKTIKIDIENALIQSGIESTQIKNILQNLQKQCRY